MSDPAVPPHGAHLYRIAPMADQHIAESRRMIQAAALSAAGTGTAIIFGTGRCREIPLALLAARFERLVLVDLDAAALEEGLAAAALPATDRAKIELRIGDISGVTAGLERDWRATLAGAPDAATAIEPMAAIADAAAQHDEEAPAATAGGPFDLVVASCLLSQLHAPAVLAAERLFAERFAAELPQLRASNRWLTGLNGLARRIEKRLIDRLPALTAPGGRIYLSETVQTCLTELAPDGGWTTPGTYRMTPTLDLSDYVNARFKIQTRGRWTWVAAIPEAGRNGKLFDVQALVLNSTASDES